jgi:hypothetical protein
MRGVVRASVLKTAVFAALILANCSNQVFAGDSTLTIGHGVVCHTADEVKAIIAPAENDMQARLLNVNDRYGKQACSVATIAFYRGDDEAAMLVPQGVVHVVKVQIVGLKQGPSWLRMETAADQYTAILDDAQGV